MVLWERSEQRERLKALWEACHGGRGGVVHIHGPAGSGKSALLRDFCTTVTAGGAAVLAAACARAEREDPLAAVRQLLGNVPAGSGCVDQQIDVTTPDALVAEVTALARDRPVVIAVDDVRHADRESVRHLLAVACRAPWSRILIVLTERTSSGNERSALHDELLGTSAAHTVGVVNLSVAGVRSLLTEYEVATDLPGTRHCWWVTGGNPLLLHALVPSLRNGGGPVPTGAGPLGGQHSLDFRAVVRQLIRSLDPPEVQVLQAAALFNGSAAVGDLQGVLGMPTTRLARVMDTLERVGLLEACRFRNPTVLDEVRADMTDGEQIRSHLRAADYLLGEHAPATAVAAHLVSAGRVPHRGMVDVLVEAAPELLAVGHVHQAKRCLDLARRSDPHPEQDAAIEFALVRVEHQIAPSSAARRLPSVLAAIPDDQLHSEPITELLEMASWYGGPEASEEVLARLAGAPGGDGRAGADLETGQMLPITIFPGMAVTAGPTATASDPEPGSYRFAGGFRNEVLAFARSVLSDGWSERAAQQSRRLLTSIELHARDARAVFVALTVMAVVGHPVSSTVCDRLIDAADDRGLVAAKAMFLAARADVNLARGHLAAAERDARAALDTLPAEGWGVGIGQPVAALQRAIAESGRAGPEVDPLGMSMPEAMFESVFSLPYLYARGAHLLALRQPRAALDHFRTCGLSMARWGLSRDVAPWRYGAAQALAALGDEHGARELLNDQLAEAANGINRGLALRMLASLSSTDTALRLLAEAQPLFDRAGNCLESARTLAKISELHDSRGEQETARLNRARARKLAQEVEAPQLVDELAARAPAGTVEPLRPEVVTAAHGGAAVLTEAELRVVELVVRGLTNRGIADHLFVTVSTVEQHLTSVFRKFKVKRRHELAALLARPIGHELSTPA